MVSGFICFWGSGSSLFLVLLDELLIFYMVCSSPKAIAAIMLVCICMDLNE